MDYLIDTNIIVLLSKEGLQFERFLEDVYRVSIQQDRLLISVVSVGELNAFIKKSGLGARRRSFIDRMILQCITVPINNKNIIDWYGDIDAYSQGKADPVPFTARNMGKNDLWIAATACAYDLPLVTSDDDFPHLDGKFLDLRYVEQELFKAYLKGQ